MTTRHFDVAAEEVEPITFAWKGETYRCRGETPALPVLKGMRAQLSGDLEKEAGAEVVLELMESVFEDGELDRILRTGVSVQKLMEIVWKVLALLNGEDVEGEASAPMPGPPSTPSAPSSDASSSSRPTSSASTGSTSGANSAAA